MARAKTLKPGPPPTRRGQGAVETILALPVFLALVCIIFQLFFLGIARIQLQYAAFCAARTGAVHNADLTEMKQTVTRILRGYPGMLLESPDHLEIEIVDYVEARDEADGSSRQSGSAPMIVRVHWYYPLLIPLADILSPESQKLQIPGRPRIHLRASWAIPIFGSISGDDNSAEKTGT